MNSLIELSHYKSVNGMKSISRFHNSERKIWLNVASSTYVMEEFVNLDNYIFLLNNV